jgi:predicted kinase
VKITVPELSLILLVGPSGCGKSTFAQKHFKPTEVLSSDYCRGLVSDDENDQTATKEAFEVLHFIARKRLAAGRLTVIDATNVQPDSRKPLVALAREFHVLPIAIVLDFPEKLCQERNRNRPNRDFGSHVVRNQAQQLRRSLRGLEREGFRGVHILKSPEELDELEIERQPMWTNRRREHGPFDRRFFNDGVLEREFLRRIQTAATDSGLWEELKTGWLCLDCELMPWSSKAQDLLRQQYAPTGAAARAGLAASIAALRATSRHVPEASELVGRFDERRTMAEHYIEAYRHYCWTVHSLEDIKLAPFHLLASEGAVHSDKDHVWHMTTLARLCASDQAILLATPYKVVDLQDEASLKDGTDWWEELTASGGEGMVVKPFQFVTKNRRGLVQPAVKCRGREYLRIIYGPEYTAPEHLERLRSRGLGTKRSLALREFALGVEALHRFVEREPLRRVHECVFGVLALESEPVDPRL